MSGDNGRKIIPFKKEEKVDEEKGLKVQCNHDNRFTCTLPNGELRKDKTGCELCIQLMTRGIALETYIKVDVIQKALGLKIAIANQNITANNIANKIMNLRGK